MPQATPTHAGDVEGFAWQFFNPLVSVISWLNLTRPRLRDVVRNVRVSVAAQYDCL
jgi:hypothetical protein